MFSVKTSIASAPQKYATAWKWLSQQLNTAWGPFWRNGSTGTTTALTQTTRLLRTSYFRQAACFAYLFLLVTLGSIVAGQYFTEKILVNHVKEMISSDVVLGYQDSSETLVKALQLREMAAPRRERAAVVIDANETVLYAPREFTTANLCPAHTPHCQGWFRTEENSTEGSREWLGYSHFLQDGSQYLIAYDILPMLDRVYLIALAAGIGIFLVLSAALWAGLHFSLGAVQRIDRIRQAMAQFTQGDMNSRIQLQTLDNEFDQLACDINLTLDRVEQLMAEVRHATNHIAHELRTPLTRLQQRLSNVAEIAQDNPRIHAEIEMAEDESQRIQYLFRAIMRISEIETGRCAHETKAVPIAALMDELQEYYGVLADKRGLRIERQIEPALVALGDQPLLFQALVNLLDNAIKYAPAHTTLTLVARRQRQMLEIGVADQGIGIAPEQRKQAVQRFHRLTKDRSIAGYGLGLSLVQAIANLHGGALQLDDNPAPGNRQALPGLRAVLVLPLSELSLEAGAFLNDS